MKLLTVFTPTYNRCHTISRTYFSLCRQTCNDFEWLIIDDGSSDGTRKWVEGLGPKTINKGPKFDWMGRRLDNEDEDYFVINLPKFTITYVYKPNGGLYTGYNTAYSIIKTELCVCIDSDDYLPDDAVAIIENRWNSRDIRKTYGGVVGLDYNVFDKKPIGGMFPDNINESFHSDLNHKGDTKEVMRTELMRFVSPMVGFKGEKDFNPFYMLRQVLDKFPVLVENRNLCWVEYQVGIDSMSQDIYKQYVRSPRSYAKYRILMVQLKHGNNWFKKLKNCGHYISSCIICSDANWFRNAPLKLMTVCAIPLGLFIYVVIKYKTRK